MPSGLPTNSLEIIDTTKEKDLIRKNVLPG